MQTLVKGQGMMLVTTLDQCQFQKRQDHRGQFCTETDQGLNEFKRVGLMQAQVMCEDERKGQIAVTFKA